MQLMIFISKIVCYVKSVFLLPLNVSSIANEINRIDSKIDLLNQKIQNLNPDLTKITSVCLHSCQDISQSSKLKISSEINKIIENHFLQIEALLSIYNSLDKIKYLPATRGWAGSPDFLHKIMEIILKNKPNFVLEASSGVSSLIIGLALKMNKYGRALSFEHDLSYAEITRKNIEINEIESSTVINSPINDCLIEGEIWKWYSTDALNLTDNIDLLIIDGPPRTTQNLARYPAIPILYKYFSDDTIILLDDANRPDEIIIVDKWIEYLKNKGCTIIIERYLNYEKGMVLLNVKKGIL